MVAEDEAIKLQVIDQLHWDSRVDATNVKVMFREGNVTLSGSVNNLRARQAAYDDARYVPGVSFVNNKTIVEHQEMKALLRISWPRLTGTCRWIRQTWASKWRTPS